MSIIFNVLVIIFLIASTRSAPPEWVYYMPFPALALMLLTGLGLFVLPRIRKSGK